MIAPGTMVDRMNALAGLTAIEEGRALLVLTPGSCEVDVF